jgi:hypothetical protein
MPKFKHDCKECQFLGSASDGWNNYDLYYCNPTKRKYAGTLIARFGDDGPDYCSGMEFAVTNPVIALAAVRAMVLGYMDAGELRDHCKAYQFKHSA